MAIEKNRSTVVLLCLLWLTVACAQSCTPSAGTYCPSSTSSPTSCLAGYYCTGDAAQDHIPCPINTYRSTAGASSLQDCLPCAQATVASVSGSTTCQQCQAGTKYTHTLPDFSDGTCDTCPAGTSSPANSVTCTQCQAGSYAATTGSDTCSSCRPGTFQSQEGASSCQSCGTGKYTYTIGANGQGYDAVWGANNQAQCLALPSASAPLVCLPGTWMDGSGCSACPLGYYCPQMTLSANDVNSIRACGMGRMSPTVGAIAASDCTVVSLLQPFVMDTCSIAPGGVGALAGLGVTAMTTSASTDTLYVTTATAVYRLNLQTTTLELLAGQEGTVGSTENAIGSAARFSSLTAIGVDMDGPEAGIIVVGDGNAVRMINVFSRVVTLIGTVGDVGEAGGVALRRDQTGTRMAYVSDVLRHRIMAFNLHNLQSFLIAGDLGGYPGKLDGSFPDTAFNQPKGIAFLEKFLNSSKLLLVADEGNNLIRVIDTDTRIVSTWFRPRDRVTPELVAPVSIAVGLSNSPQAMPIVYVTDAAGGVSAIQFPDSADHGLKVLTKVHLSSVSLNLKTVLPHGVLTTGANSAVGYGQLLVLDGSIVESLVQDVIALTVAAGAPGSCHLPCVNSDCTPLTPEALCGNSFLDAGEQCDDGFADPNSGCDMTTCTIKAGYVCAVGFTACSEPYKGYLHARTGVWYRAEDCAALTPAPGYTIDDHCVETDIDECTMGTSSLCDVQAKCINTAGAYACQCFETYFGDGHTCSKTAFAVYSVVDIPSLPRNVFNVPLSPTASAVMTALEDAYAAAMSAINSGPTIFSLMTPAELARAFTTYSLDTSNAAFTRMELVTLFESAAKAELVAAQVGNLDSALSLAIGATVSVFQAPKVRGHKAAASYTGSNVIDGWGMNITSVTYNRTCVVTGVTPTGGCWQVEMIYIGGQEMSRSNENPNVIEQSKNVLYLPRLDHNPATMQLTSPTQALTMNSGMFFPCDVSSTSAAGNGMTPKATACCLRNVESTYRPHAGFADFLNSADYNAAVPHTACMSNEGINDTFPASNIVFKLPEGDGKTNDLVVGKIEGMPHSEVKLLETIDYTTRTFRVMLVLEEGDLRMGAALTEGIWGLEYNLTFFVGLANFKGTGTSVMNTRNSVEFITVSKSNVLTISTYGANQDPLVSSVDMQLKRIKVTDFFNAAQYLYYLQPVFTMPSNFKNRPDGSIVPINSIRLIKAHGTPGAHDMGWMQACDSMDGNFIYANTSLQALVQKAQKEACVQSNLQMCYPPSKANNVISFGIPLPIDFFQSADYAGGSSLDVQFVVQAYDTNAMTNVYSTLSMSVEITPMGFTAICESMTASQTLADIIEGDIYIGTATNSVEWDTTVQKKVNIDVPGKTPSNSFQFAATTVQGAIMTFAALGDPNYFEDARYTNQFVHIHDLHSVHFLEPLGSLSGPSPNFDAVKALFLAGTAFITKTDAAQHSEWLEPSPALLNICPYRATAGKMACLTRTESTFKNTQVTRDPDVVVELRQNDPGSVAEMENLMSQVILQGGVNDFTNQLGAGFHNELSTQLSLNNRYRKAYVVNPVMDWSFEAMQNSQVGSTGYTVCSKIIAIGMVTIRTPDGTQLARRLLSTDMQTDVHPQILQKMNAANMAVKHLTSASVLLNDPLDYYYTTVAGRRMLQAANGLEPSLTQSSNSLVLNVNVPGYDATSQLCTIVLGAPYNHCNIVQLQTQVSGGAAINICKAQQEGTLGTQLHTGLGNTLQTGARLGQIKGVALLEYTTDGCDAVLKGAGRRLLGATQDFTIVTQKVIVSSVNGSATLNTVQLAYLQDFFNTSTWTQILGGGGYISFVTMTFTDVGGNIVNADISIGIKNSTNKDTAVQVLNNSVARDYSQGDRMFTSDYYTYKGPSSSSGERVAVLGISIASFTALSAALLLA